MYIYYTINVSPYQITLTPDSGSCTYDGTEKSVSGFETLEFAVRSEAATIEDGTIECTACSDTFKVSGLTAEAKGTDAGEYPVDVSGQAVVTNAADKDVTGWCALNYADAKLVIGQRPITLTSASDSKEYDGKPLTNNEVTVGGDGWAPGEGATYSVTGSQLIKGSSLNTFTYTLTDATKPGNYDISAVEGTLTVSARSSKFAITATPNSKTVVYDGNEQSVSGFETLCFTVNGQAFTVSGLAASATGTGAGAYPVAVTGTPVVKDEYGNDVSSQFEVTIAPASLTIAPKQIAKPAEDLTAFTYNGQPQTYGVVSTSGYTVANGTQIDAGTHTVTVALADKDNTVWAGGSSDDLVFFFTIAKASPSLKVEPSKPALYGGGIVTLTVDNSQLPNGAQASVGCSDANVAVTPNGDGTFTANLPNATKDYTFTASYEDANHKAADATCTVSVTAYVPPAVPQAATDVIKLINALPAVDDITLEDGEAIEAARRAYDALTAYQKSFVPASAVTKLEAVEEKYEEISTPTAETMAVILALTALPQADELNVADAREAVNRAESALEGYASLDDGQKALVDEALVVNAESIVAKGSALVAEADAKAVGKVRNKKFSVKYGKKKVIYFKTKISAAGTKVVYEKVRGSKYITVTKAGKVTAKKGLKKGWEYVVTVKVTCGDAAKTVKVTVRVR